MTFVIGLTGSIGMGKSTTAQVFAEEGVPVWDADAAVRKLYEPGGAAVESIRHLVPEAITDQGVSREKLRDAISKDASILDALNAAVHPLVKADREAFIATNSSDIVLIDVPLLFETGGSDVCDLIVVVTASAEVQKERVMARGEMTEAEFEMIKSRQMPDAEKRAKADRIIETLSLDHARAEVRTILKEVRGQIANA